MASESARRGEQLGLFDVSSQTAVVGNDRPVSLDERNDANNLPEGWQEAYPGGLATNKDPVFGGIVDSEIVSGKWFAISNQDAIEKIEGLNSRKEAFDALHDAVTKAKQLESRVDTPLADSTAQVPAVRAPDIGNAAPVKSPVPVDTKKNVNVAVTPGAPAAIVDAGEELTYNRRNRIRTGKKWADISGLNDALKVKETVKANIWPKPDYKQLIADGMQPMVAHIVKQVYDSVAVKPVIRGVLDDAALQRYISALNRVEAGLMQWAQDPVALKQWAEANARVASAMLGRQVAVSSLGGKSKTLLEAVFPEGWRERRDELTIAGGNKLLGALQPGYAEINRAIKAVGKGWPEKREAWEIQGYRIVESPEIEALKSPYAENSYFLAVGDKFVQSYSSMEDAQAAAAKVKPFVLFGKKGMLDSFASEEEAVAAAKDLAGRQKGTVISEKGIRVEAVERIGVSRRMEGEDISSERLMDEFGFRGVNFGNWLKAPSARAEAQLHLNHAYDSAHDLAEILGIPPKAIGLNGMLGLAIGAQGAGGHAAAHFVPGVNEINLTRTSGAGSLAHEWAHALDHYFATTGGLSTSEVPYLTVHSRRGAAKSFGELRPEIVAAFSTIVETMDKRDQTEEETKSAQNEGVEAAKKSVNNWLKAIRRDFVGQEEAFDVLAERIRAGDVGEGMVAVSRNSYVSPVVAEMRDLYKAHYGRIYSLENAKGLQAWISIVQFRENKLAADGDHVPQKVATEFAKNAALLDKNKGGKPYWSTSLEKFARAFDAFVSDELEAREAKNNYLSHAGRQDETVPNGEERQRINSAFRVLVGEVRTRETERGVALFSKAIGKDMGGQTHSIQSATTALIDAHTGKDREVLQALLDGGKVRVITGNQAQHIIGDRLFAEARNGFTDIEPLGFREGPPTKENVAAMKEWLSNHSDLYKNEYTVMYHGAPEHTDILNQGLLKTSETRRKSFQSRPGFVYLAPTPERARYFGDLANSSKSKVYAVRVLVRKLKADTDQLNNQRSVGNNVGNTLAESLVYGGSARVDYNIPPHDIRPVEINQDIRFSENGQALAFFNQEDGVTYFVADHLPLAYSKQEWRGLVRHEIGVHALRLGKRDAEFQSILKSLEAMREAGDEDVVKAFSFVPKSTPAAYVTEEALAYLVQKKPDLPIIGRAIAWFRKSIRSLGDSVPLLKRTTVYEWADTLSKGDVLYMAQTAMADAFQTGKSLETETEIAETGVMFSKVQEWKAVDEISARFKESISDFIRAGTPLSGNIRLSENTPASLQMFGWSDNPVEVSSRVIDKMVYDHALSETQLAQIPYLMRRPTMMFGDAKNNSIVMIGELREGKPALLALKPERVGAHERTLIVTAYEPNLEWNEVSKRVLRGELIYRDSTASIPDSVKSALSAAQKKYSQESESRYLPEELLSGRGSSVVGSRYKILWQSDLVKHEQEIWNDQPLFSQPFDGPEVAVTPVDLGQDTIMVDGISRPLQNSTGNPIHWSEEGVKNFWRAFSGTKVVDSEGRPLVAYHGTDQDFNVFETSAYGTLGSGAYFVLSKEEAEVYGDMVVPVYLKIDRPWKIELDHDSEGSLREDFDSPSVEAVLSLPNGRDLLEAAKNGNGMYGPALQAQLIRLGYDGIMATYPDGSAEYVAFDPKQIKSAIENNGAFNLNTATILCSHQELIDDVVSSGTFSGRVLDVAGGVVVQKTGRGEESARHDASRLSTNVAIGDVIDIKYKDGLGIVGVKGKSLHVAR